MGAMRFCTTPKEYLPQYSYIFRNMDPLGSETSNANFSRLGTILHPETQKGKEAMETSNFQKNIIGNAACMNIITMAKKGREKLKSNDTYFSDSWFSGVKTSEEAMAEGVDYCGPAKTSHKSFCLSTL